MKKITSIIVALAMVFSVLTVAPSKVSAKVTILTGTKMTIVVGKSDSIYVKGQKKAKFKSSNKKVVSVSKKGKVKGKKTGKAKVTVKVGKSSKKVSVTVIPANAKITSAAAAGTNSVKVNIKKTKGAKGYYIYYSTDNKKFSKKATTKTTYTFTNLAGGKTYYFKVKAYGNSKTVSKKYSAVSSVKLWKMVWSDEFNAKSLNTSVWTYETGQSGWGNEELQNYTAGDNIEFDGSNLVIVPRVKVPSTCKTTKIATVAADPSGHLYTKLSDDYKSYFAKDKYAVTSTRIISKGKKEVKYGKMEMRAKSAVGKGAWSAGWMLGNDSSTNTWPKCGEIDIFESMNGGTPMTIHCPAFNNSKKNMNFNSGISQVSGSTAFHTYVAEWTPKTISFYADGKKVRVYDPKKFSAIPYDETWVFDHPFFFIFNCAIGGNAAGDVDLSNWATKKKSGDLTIYEDRLYVDYVRVYE